MNKSLTLACTALLLASTAPAFAASSVDLTVKGLITPSACTPNLPGTVDFGKISAKDLNQESQTLLEAKTLQLTVSCEASTLFAINPVDNRVGSSTHGGAYGLGLINGTQKLGRYFITLRNPVTDIPSIMLTMYTEGRWTELDEAESVEPNRLFAFGDFNSESGWAPHALENAAVEIVLNTAIAPAKNLTLTNEVALDGSATLEVKYL